MPGDDEKERKSECASQLGRELPMRMEAAKRLPAINRQSWQCEKKTINPTSLRKKSEFAVIDFDEVITSTMWLAKTNMSSTLFMWKILRSTSRLARYIANLASLDQWLAPIRNNRIRWSMNLKKSQKDRIVDDGTLKRMKQTMKNYENALENHENQPKILKAKTSKSTCNDNNRISSDGNVCPKNIGIASLKKKTIATKNWPSFKSIFIKRKRCKQ